MPNPGPTSTPLLAFVGLFCFGSIAAWAWAIGQRWHGQPVLPQAKTRPVPWGFGSVLTILGIYLLANTILPVLLHRWIMGQGPSLLSMEKHSPEAFFIEQLLLLAFINAGMLVIVPEVLKLTSGATLSDLGVGRHDHIARNLVAGLVGWLMFTPGVYGVFALALQVWKAHGHPLEKMMRANGSTPVVVLAVISGVILAPAVEELFFRGILQGWLTRVLPEVRPLTAQPAVLLPEEPGAEDLDLVFEPDAPVEETRRFTGLPRLPWRLPDRAERQLRRLLPNVITSIVFASVHAPQWPAPVAIFALSMVLGLLYQRTRSVAGPFALHALFNGLSTLMLFTSLG